MNTHDYEYVEALEKKLDKINNIAVGFVEGGPYEDANRIALTAMLAIDELSRLPKNKEATNA